MRQDQLKVRVRLTRSLPVFLVAAAIASPAAADTWTTGAYLYDAAGNIIAIGPHPNQKTDYYVYDRVNRLARANAHTDSNRNDQQFQYDELGNIESTILTALPAGGGARATEIRDFNPSASTKRHERQVKRVASRNHPRWRL